MSENLIRPRLRTARPVARSRGNRDWFRIGNHAADGDSTDVWIYDEIGYWGTTAEEFARALAGITTPRLTLHISSPGGDVFDAVAIYSTLKNHPAAVDVRVEGLAASAASFIAQAGDTIVIEKPAQMMIHEASGLCIGDARDMQSMADLLHRVSDTIAGIYADRAGGTVESWRAAMRAETWYSSGEAVAAGLADSVAGAEPDDTASEPVGPDDDDAMAAWDLSIFTYRGRENAPPPRLPAAAADVPPDGQVTKPDPADPDGDPAEAGPAEAGPAEADPRESAEPEESGPDGPAISEWGDLVAALTTTPTAPIDPIGVALASLREATQ